MTLIVSLLVVLAGIVGLGAAPALGAWPYTSGGSTGQALSVAVDSNDNVFIVGNISGPGSPYPSQDYQFAVVKVTGGQGGGTEINRRTNFGDGEASVVLVAPTGHPNVNHVFAAGWRDLGGTDANDIFVVHLNNALGDIPGWSPPPLKGSLSGGWDEAADIALTSDAVFVAGWATEVSNGRQLWVHKLDADTGDPIWDGPLRRGGSGDDRAKAIAVSVNNEVVVGGSQSGTSQFLYVARLTNPGLNGTPGVQWDFVCSSAVAGFDANLIRDVAIGADGYAYAVGRNGNNFYVVRLAVTRQTQPGTCNPVTGAGEWQRNNIAGQADALVLDSAGHVVVVGRNGSGTMILHKLNKDTGLDMWSPGQVVLSGASCPNSGCDVTVDTVNSPVVVGQRNGKVFASKRGGADGSFLWEEEVLTGYGTSIATDSTGASVFAGGSLGSNAGIIASWRTGCS